MLHVGRRRERQGECECEVCRNFTRSQSSFSAAWRGIRSEQASRRRSESSTTLRSTSRPRNGGGSCFDTKFGAATSGPPTGRERHRIKRAFKKMRQKEEKKEQDMNGRKSRSKRFNDPESDFGKKSLVYQINKGGLKDKITKLLESKQSDTPTESQSRSYDRTQNYGERSRNTDRTESRSYNRTESHDERSRNIDSQARDRRSGFDRMRQRAREELGGEERDDARDDARDDEFWALAGPGRKSGDFAAALPYTTAASQFLFGRWPVLAALREARRKIYHLYIYAGASNRQSIEFIRTLAEKHKVRTTVVPESRQHLLDNVSKGRPHNGVILEVSPLPQLPILGLGPVAEDGYTVDIGHQLKEDVEINGSEPFQRWDSRGAHKPLVVLLHEVMDPGNLGAMLRTARFLGAAAVAVTKQSSSPITPTVVKAAAGAAEELTIFSVADPLAFLESSRDVGWASYVAVAPSAGRSGQKQLTADELAEEDPLREKPCILVLGNEGEGLSRKMISRADCQVSVLRQARVGTSSVDSLNVSVAAALLCDAFTRGARAAPKTFQQALKLDEKKALGSESLF
ncbi:hypothetical protein SODALDRAFT_340866 [Sodiomyces alkalinus F11]|uniref:rRNA methyltransferase 1, mitochondrial n=1 Tax=Sodiomyces alkalinus (strain CBS 110278 / VKM F-3762 / F11) TaxID=1314773 RepID=A0A3N2PTE1_SODAK|nr:hypothetical protein SODALDRAFT_340866 [Sodiomyces alkalinus F11]ROT37694.1 hypothetical protein SODALDRAFT_340866 [Sodiomyces alkalinus F11]